MPKQQITITLPTIPTAVGTVNGYGISPGGRLVSAVFSGVEALGSHAANIASFALKNLGQGGAGNVDMLDTTAINSTNSVGGAALVANAQRSLRLHGTPTNRDSQPGDRLKFAVTGAGVLANTVTEGRLLLTFSKSL